MSYKPPQLPTNAILLEHGFDCDGQLDRIHSVTVLDVDDNGLTIICQAMSQRILATMGAKRPAWYKGNSPFFVPWTDIAFIAYPPSGAAQ